jgi:hypothetical protein
VHVADELILRARFSDAVVKRRGGEHALPREEHQDRGNDGEVREQRVDVAEAALALAPCRMMSRTAANTSFIMPKVSGSNRGAPDASSRSMIEEPGSGGGFFDDGGHPGVGLEVGGLGTVGDGSGACPNRAKHVAGGLRGHRARLLPKW